MTVATRWLMVVLGAAFLVGCSDDDLLSSFGDYRLEITAPTGAVVDPEDAFVFTAEAESSLGVDRIELRIGAAIVKECPVSGQLTECSAQLSMADVGEMRVGPSLQLSAKAQFSDGKSRTAELKYGLRCLEDTECRPGRRCCRDDGRCHDVVESGGLCSCTAPCPSSEGCFAGTCDAPPRRCRPTCSLGRPYVDDSDLGELPDFCPDQLLTNPDTGVEERVDAYCFPLPSGDENVGACAPVRRCSIERQDCPDGLLFPALPPGDDNPIVAYNCQLIGMNGKGDVTSCFPAGPIQAYGTGCATAVCGEYLEYACAKGTTCTVRRDGETEGDQGTCRPYCGAPGGRSSCGSGEVCGGLYPGAGDSPFASGVCVDEN